MIPRFVPFALSALVATALLQAVPSVSGLLISPALAQDDDDDDDDDDDGGDDDGGDDDDDDGGDDGGDDDDDDGGDDDGGNDDDDDDGDDGDDDDSDGGDSASGGDDDGGDDDGGDRAVGSASGSPSRSGDDDDDSRAGDGADRATGSSRRSASDGDGDDARRPAADAAPRDRRARVRETGPLRRYSLPRGETDRARSAEISGAFVAAADLARLQELGFQVISSRQVGFFGGTLALRLRTPRQFTPQVALQVARTAAPTAVFDFSHIYNSSQGSSVFGRELVKIGVAAGCGRGLRIGLIDSEVARHSSLRGAQITRRSFTKGPGDARHGTAVASLLVGSDPSGQPTLDGAQLYAAEVFAWGAETLDADAVDIVGALDWLVRSRAGVINLSIAGPPNQLLGAAVAASVRSGAILVAAGGNNTAGGAPRYPAAYPDVIGVSAVDSRTRPYPFNTRGAYIDIAAPGVDVWAAEAGGGGGALWSGTSFAAPFVTVALASAVRRGEVSGADGARRYLAANARDLGPSGRDPMFGYGLLQSTGC